MGPGSTSVLFDTCIGWMGLESSPVGITKVILPQKSREAVLSNLRSHQCFSESRGLVSFGDLPQRIKSHLAGEPVDFPDIVDLSEGSLFQRSVWEIVRTIPYGETSTYARVASQIRSRDSARAVGQALARNPVPIIIPCHRVISNNGDIGGFSGGLELKRFLLKIEGTDVK